MPAPEREHIPLVFAAGQILAKERGDLFKQLYRVRLLRVVHHFGDGWGRGSEIGGLRVTAGFGLIGHWLPSYFRILFADKFVLCAGNVVKPQDIVVALYISLRYMTQGRKPSVSTERRLAELGRLFEELERFVAGENIGPWLKEPNPAFNGSTPLQVVERGETDRIWRMLYELESGEPG